MSDNTTRQCPLCRCTLRSCSCLDVCAHCGQPYIDHTRVRRVCTVVLREPDALRCPTSYQEKTFQTGHVRVCGGFGAAKNQVERATTSEG